MLKRLVLLTLGVGVMSVSVSYADMMSTAAAAEKPAAQSVIWTVVFANTQPNRTGVTQAQCDAETPTVVVSTMGQVTSPAGVMALNQVNVHYASYNTTNVNGLGFTVVKATLSGVDAKGHAWSEPMSIYEQNLSPTDVTDAVWSTSNCKGKFVGTATVL